MTKLVKGEPGWAISGRNKRVDLASWRVFIDGVEAGQVYQVLGSGKKWRVDVPGRITRNHPATRAEAVTMVELMHGTPDHSGHHPG